MAWYERASDVDWPEDADWSGTLTIPLETTVGAHKAVDRVRLQAVHSFGLTVDSYDVAGGWFSKSHVLKVSGDVADLKRFIAWVESIES
jgi:hypothetical protein